MEALPNVSSHDHEMAGQSANETSIPPNLARTWTAKGGGEAVYKRRMSAIKDEV